MLQHWAGTCVLLASTGELCGIYIMYDGLIGKCERFGRMAAVMLGYVHCRPPI